MLYTALIGVHVLACIFLIAVVLLQTGKGADMGAVFGGGSSDTVFGSSGAGNFLTKLTTGVAILFMVTSLVMTYGLARQTSQSLFDDVRAPATPQEGEPTDELPAADAEAGDTSETQSAAPPLTESAPTVDDSAVEAETEATAEAPPPVPSEKIEPQAEAPTATPGS